MKNLGIKRRTFLSGTVLFGASALLKSPKAFSTSLPKKMVGLYGPIQGVAKLNVFFKYFWHVHLKQHVFLKSFWPLGVV